MDDEQQKHPDMGSSLELASQALAATGSHSTVKATEWILNQRRSGDVSKMSNNASRGGGVQGSQSKLDQFFTGGFASKSLQLRAGRGDDLGPAGVIESEGNSGESRGRGVPEESDQEGQTAAVVAVTSGGGGGRARAGIVGGFDSVTGAALGWRSVNSVRGEHEDVASSGYEGGEGGTSDVRYNMVKVGSLVPASRAEEQAGGHSLKSKRALVSPGGNNGGGGGGGGSSTNVKRQKQGTETGPERTLAPIFTTSQFSRPSNNQNVIAGQAVPGRSSLAPLAERMRPASIDEVVGQDHLLAPRHIIRTLVDNDTVPSIIFFGPPGTGKTSLARAIARAVPGLRYVGLSAVNGGTKEVREVLDEARKRVNRQGQRTLLFLDEVHRFNKAQQDLFLPSVESGDIIFIGATTENPSFEINAALLSRCRVLTLNKLEPQHLRIVLERAVVDRDRGVFASLPDSISTPGGCTIKVEEDALNFLAGAADGDARVALNAIEVATTAAYSEAKLQRKTQNQDAVGIVPTMRLVRAGSSGSLAGLAKKEPAGPGTSERANNGFGSKRLEALMENAKESLHSKEDYSKPFKRFVGGKEITQVHNPARFEVSTPSTGDVGRVVMPVWLVEGTEATERKGSHPDVTDPEGAGLDASRPGLVVTVTLAQVQEAFQRSHVLYDKTGEEHYNIISALHKSMRGGDADAAIYWLARMLEGGEGPLYVARRLIRFASEDVGLADPNAMGIAVACYQACHFLGMPECNVNLAQCVVYLAYAPKSVVVYQAIETAQKLIRETQQNEPVPLHLRNAPTRLMKDMGYGQGYIYPPGQAGRVEQEYMPPSLHGRKFLKWPEA